MEREEPWPLEKMLDGKQTVKFQTPDGRWASLVPDDIGCYHLFVEEFAREINPDERLTPDQIADRTMNRITQGKRPPKYD